MELVTETYKVDGNLNDFFKGKLSFITINQQLISTLGLPLKLYLMYYYSISRVWPEFLPPINILLDIGNVEYFAGQTV